MGDGEQKVTKKEKGMASGRRLCTEATEVGGGGGYIRPTTLCNTAQVSRQKLLPRWLVR